MTGEECEHRIVYCEVCRKYYLVKWEKYEGAYFEELPLKHPLSEHEKPVEKP